MCISSSVSTSLPETDSIAHHHLPLLDLFLLQLSLPLLATSSILLSSLLLLLLLLFKLQGARVPSRFRSSRNWVPFHFHVISTSSAMAFTLRKGFSVSGVAGCNNKKPLAGGGPRPPSSLVFSPWKKREFRGDQQMVLRDQPAGTVDAAWASRDHAVHAASFCVPPSMRWWEKGEAPNMVEIGSTQELVDSLLGAGDSLAVVDFYSPGCGGCKALHPKICQIAEKNPDVLFLKVNYEEHRSMCNSLNVHVLPFFRFYRGAQGRVCSFSCTNATIKKFRDALAKHGGERRCDVAGAPAKGLEESELLKLASINGELQFELPPISTRMGTDLEHDRFPGSLVDGVAEAGRRATALSP